MIVEYLGVNLTVTALYVFRNSSVFSFNRSGAAVTLVSCIATVAMQNIPEVASDMLGTYIEVKSNLPVLQYWKTVDLQMIVLFASACLVNLATLLITASIS